MRNEILYRDNHIAIELDSENNWIYVNWRGYQNYDSVQGGCAKILELMQMSACYRILNDNTQVEGQWSSASNWLSEEWFPAMREAGMERFAWVYASSMLSRLSTDKTMKNLQHSDDIRTFDEIEIARDWLRFL